LQLSSFVRIGGHLAAGAVTFLLVSCGDGRSRTYPVKGQVKVNGQPAAGVEVVLVVTNDQKIATANEQPAPRGTTQADGSFELSTFGAKDGAPPGDYGVSLTWPAWSENTKIPPDKLRNKFSDPAKSGLQAHVDTKPTTLPAFEVTAEVLSDKEVEDTKKLKAKELRRRSKTDKDY